VNLSVLNGERAINLVALHVLIRDRATPEQAGAKLELSPDERARVFAWISAHSA
jgi:hypothetical protein